MNREDINIRRKNLDGTWTDMYPETKAELVEGAPPKTLTIETENSIEIDGHTHKFLLDGTLISGAKIGYYENTEILVSDTNEVNINIPEYNKEDDLLLVHINSVFIKKGTDYEIIGNESVRRLDLDAWEEESIMDFLVIKNIEYNYPSDHVIKPVGAHSASAISIDGSGFNGNLDPSIDDVQKLSEAVDVLSSVGGFSLNSISNESQEIEINDVFNYDKEFEYDLEDRLLRIRYIKDNKEITTKEYTYYEDDKISEITIKTSDKIILDKHYYNEKNKLEKISRLIDYIK